MAYYKIKFIKYWIQNCLIPPNKEASELFKGTGIIEIKKIYDRGVGVRGISHVQCDGGGWRASAMFKVMGGLRGVSHVQGDGGEGRQPC